MIDITTPNNLHVEPALVAMEAGKHVYCEKPMAVKVEDAQRMASAAKKAGVHTMVAFNNLKTPAALVAKDYRPGRNRRANQVPGKVRSRIFNDPLLPWSWRCSRACRKWSRVISVRTPSRWHNS